MSRPSTSGAALAALLVSMSLSHPALAQTALGQSGAGQPGAVSATPPGKNPASPFPSANHPAAVPPSQMGGGQAGAKAATDNRVVPMSDDVHKQAIYQTEGVYPEMDRSGAGAGGQIQDAWNISEMRDGVYTTRLCEDCVYKVRTREFMITTLVLPPDAVIASADLGDATGFKVQVKSSNMLAIRPTAYGLDTNLNVYTKSGALYPFYIRSESFNSIHVPDLIVKILGNEKPKDIEGLAIDGGDDAVEGAGKATTRKKGDKTANALHDLANPKPGKGDFVRNVPFDPDKLRGWADYSLRGSEELKPEIVYRDDFFTYIRYGEKWDGMELSTAYVTIDGVDELVNTRVQGSTFIVESVNPLITLKNGKRFLCLQYKGA